MSEAIKRAGEAVAARGDLDTLKEVTVGTGPEATDTAYDYSNWETDIDAGSNLMARIEGLAQEQLDAQARVEALEAQLAEAKVAVTVVKEHKLPNLLEEAQLGKSKVVTPGGIVINLKEVIRGTIPKGKEDPAHEWLEENGNGALIKRTVTIDFNKDQEAWARKFMADCNKRKKPLNLKLVRGVHASTLRSFVKTALAEGIAIPMDVFGVYRQRFTDVKVKT